MKANNLTICIPTKSCTRNCPYCISKMTPATLHAHKELNYHNQIRKAISFAKTAGANSILITARGEPLTEMQSVLVIAQYANDAGMPCELQTNGDLLTEDNIDLLKEHVDVFAVSVDSPEQLHKQDKGMTYINDLNKVLRWTILLHDVNTEKSIEEWLYAAQSLGVNQLSFRKLAAPTNPMNIEPLEWIKENTKNVDKWLINLGHFLSNAYKNNFPIIRKLSFGPIVYDVNGIALTYFPYCIEEGTETEEIRSLILRENGHVYTTWNSLASILF